MEGTTGNGNRDGSPLSWVRYMCTLDRGLRADGGALLFHETVERVMTSIAWISCTRIPWFAPSLVFVARLRRSG
jgi:hypothetical protein